MRNEGLIILTYFLFKILKMCQSAYLPTSRNGVVSPPFEGLNSIPAIFRQLPGVPTKPWIQERQPICYLRKHAVREQRASCQCDHYILPSVGPSGRYTNSPLTSKIMPDHYPRSLGVHLFCITYHTTSSSTK